jgi:transcriptional accessory protein Tex/SPT6
VRLFSLVWLAFLFVFLFSITGCTQDNSPKSVSEQFWQAVTVRDMETAKQLSTWDTVDYLKYLKAEKLHPERFELGEEMLGDANAEIATTLFTKRQGKSGVKVPGVTVLVKIEQGWRVDVKKTLSSVVEKTVDNVFNQFNGFLQEGLQQLDKSLSESMKEIGKALEDGAKDLRNELNKEFPKQQRQSVPQNGEHSGKPI